MHHRRAHSRSRDFARRLPAVLLSGLFMIVTAGLPALASTAQTRELSVEAKHEIGIAALTAIQDLPEVSAATPPLESGLLPPSSAGTAVDPLDLYLLGTSGGDGADALPGSGEDCAHHDRAPPGTGQQ